MSGERVQRHREKEWWTRVQERERKDIHSVSGVDRKKRNRDKCGDKKRGENE